MFDGVCVWVWVFCVDVAWRCWNFFPSYPVKLFHPQQHDAKEAQKSMGVGWRLARYSRSIRFSRFLPSVPTSSSTRRPDCFFSRCAVVARVKPLCFLGRHTGPLGSFGIYLATGCLRVLELPIHSCDTSSFGDGEVPQ